ncbi:diacylglycerol kinase family protein [Candidatus Daviesbacteria bacterium]|nr:diacylglycerol kinase family protein [Candidatus Daviesbacteria bacterium]
MRKQSILSFKHALEGIWTATKDEPHLKFHFSAAFVVIILGVILKLTREDWAVIVLTIGLVIGLELTNTAIEEIVNSFTPDTHPAAKKAKDVAAGAVLVASVTAAVIGILIFLPYLIKFFGA